MRRKSSTKVEVNDLGDSNNVRTFEVTLQIPSSVLSVADFLARNGAYETLPQFVTQALVNNVEQYLDGVEAPLAAAKSHYKNSRTTAS